MRKGNPIAKVERDQKAPKQGKNKIKCKLYKEEGFKQSDKKEGKEEHHQQGRRSLRWGRREGLRDRWRP